MNIVDYIVKTVLPNTEEAIDVIATQYLHEPADSKRGKRLLKLSNGLEKMQQKLKKYVDSMPKSEDNNAAST